MAKKFKVKKRFNLPDKILLWLSFLLKKHPKIINLNDGGLPEKCIMLGNHNGAGGPFNYRAFMKGRWMSWGAHQMCENFRSRRKYLYHIFYRQKLGFGKFRSRVMSVILGFFAPWIYHCAGIIPVYFDSRILLTYKYSMACLEQDVRVFVFPEDSDNGYKEIIEKMWPGFLQLAKLHYKRAGTDLPIYTLRYNPKPKRIVIGKPMYYRELAKEHTDDEILQIFTDYMNSLKEIS